MAGPNARGWVVHFYDPDGDTLELFPPLPWCDFSGGVIGRHSKKCLIVADATSIQIDVGNVGRDKPSAASLRSAATKV